MIKSGQIRCIIGDKVVIFRRKRSGYPKGILDGVELTGTAKLSQNFFKKNDDGKFVNMLTYRSNTCGRITFQSEVEMIKSLLEEYCYDYEKVEVEYAVYDTNVTHDAKWIAGK